MMLRDLAGDTEGRTHDYIFVGGTEMKNWNKDRIWFLCVTASVSCF